MIKGKLPYPFQTIALAVSFAPGLSKLVAELKRLCEIHKAIAVFIHIGKKTNDKQRELSSILSTFGFHDGNSRIYWEQGDTVSCILRICKHEVVDLILTGASERENFELPVGKISSAIGTKAKCSVLIVKEIPTQGYKIMVVNGVDHRKSDLTMLTALYFAENEHTENMFVADDNSGNVLAESSANFPDSSFQPDSNQFRETLNKTKINVTFFSLEKEHCSSITEYAFKNKADLIVTNSSDHHLLIFDRISTSDGIESLLKDLSCNLFIVHSRISE